MYSTAISLALSSDDAMATISVSATGVLSSSGTSSSCISCVLGFEEVLGVGAVVIEVIKNNEASSDSGGLMAATKFKSGAVLTHR